MEKRNPIAVFAFSFITVFIYSWYWLVKTKGEMNKMGEKIPTAFFWLIPIVGPLWWLWKYSEAVEHVTHKEISGVLAFVVLWLLGPIGNAIVQDFFNKIAAAPVTTGNTAQAAPVNAIPQSVPTQPSEQTQNPPEQPPANPQNPTTPLVQ